MILTEKLKIQYPIIQAPMAGGITTPELVSAVSNAGGLGSLGAGYMSAAEIKSAIHAIRELTNKPFAVNLFIPETHHAAENQIIKSCHNIEESCTELQLKIIPAKKPYAPSFEKQMNVLIEEKIPIFSFTFGLLDSAWINKLKKNNTILIGTATNLAEAIALEKNGVDMIVAQGSEAGGHRSTFLGEAEDSLIHLSALISQIKNKINIPIIAAGGMMNRKNIAAMLAIGASSVQMGTAFLSCHESGAHPKYKEILLLQTIDKTILTRAFSGKLARGIENKFTTRMECKKENILDYPIQNALTHSMRKMAKEKNNPDFMSLWAGQFAYLSKRMSVGELMRTEG